MAFRQALDVGQSRRALLPPERRVDVGKPEGISNILLISATKNNLLKQVPPETMGIDEKYK